MRVVKTIAEEGFGSVPTCCADGGSNSRGNLPSVGVVERQNTVGRNVRARRGVKDIGFGAVPRMEMRTVKTSLTTHVVVPSAVMVAVVCVDESV
jgi:hypothetical protein